MSSGFSNIITMEHVLKAVRKIKKEKKRLRPSTGYDVIIEGKRYPPKEIIRIAYRIATGKDVGVLYGGEQVNEPLQKLGFKVERKISVWKLGCNWGKGAPSYYERIREERIVLGTLNFNYQVGDLILITEGFTVRAIAKVTRSLRPIISSKRLQSLCSEFQIDFEGYVLFERADWYVLPDTDVFTYQLQQGIRRVNQQAIIEKTIDLWENKDSKIFDFNFYLAVGGKINSTWSFPCFVLTADSWNDYGYETSFDLSLFKTRSRRVQIGAVKILAKSEKHTKLPESFSGLDPFEFCSLGQSTEYYNRLKTELPRSYVSFLRALNDTAFNKKARTRSEDWGGFKESLLRSSEAEFVLNNVRQLIGGLNRTKQFDFSFRVKIGAALEEHKVDLSFYSDELLPNRFFCLVGKNGTGKTKFISLLANKLIDDKQGGTFHPRRPEFSKIIATSFSYFDSFKFPQAGDISYEFIGIKSAQGVVTEEETLEVIWKSFERVSGDEKKKRLWERCIEGSLEMDYLNFSMPELANISTIKEFNSKVNDIFSSGQKIVFQFVTRLIAVIEENSLVIFDEPETHLHPNIAGRLIRTLDLILKECNSFCILSTHSPIVVQEIPSRFIKIFERKGLYPIVYDPPIECLGENLSNLSNAIFHTGLEKELYKVILEKLAEKMTPEEIDNAFENRLSINAKLFIQSNSK